ncbi:hypothetical protein LZ578_04560 [Jeotgalibaca sp. MA1X17-3]|uniref:hypothetical protein n=1 Tax=Jeotgalibaca sp. MA1X17-3 TaxID=2908211 RepID=UPI001F1D308D|nr:hypothetical protein [Jeotgalibaca sp. MA1X17-3]UJF16395.1 hypothetical protein LZ578_04560 [Jeotgalibaca sp. MA1X17-3]
MFKIKQIFIMSLTGIILGACSGENATDSSDHVLDEPEQTSEASLDGLDAATKAELEKENPEDINWENVHLTKGQFKEYIERFHTSLNDSSTDEENTLIVHSIKMLTDTEIEIIIENTDQSEFAEFTNSFFGWTMDTIIRQMYIRSDFFDGVNQVTIRTQDQQGEIVSESNDFIELDEN